MTSPRGLVVRAGLGMVGAAVLIPAVPAFALVVPPPLHHASFGKPFVGAVKAVSVTNDVGDITIQSGPKAAVGVVEQWSFSRPTVTWRLTDGVLSATAHCPTGVLATANNCWADLIVTAPASATVTANDADGDVRTFGMTADQTLGSADGDISATLTAAPRELRAHSDDGDVTLHVPVGAYAVSAKSYDGDVRVRGITRNADAPHHIAATSDTGDVTIKGSSQD